MMKFVVLALALFAVAAAADEDLKTAEATYLAYNSYPYPLAYNNLYYNNYEPLLVQPSVRYIQPYIRPAVPLEVNTRILGTDLAGRTVDVQGRDILLAKK